jgi:hypothetical protein
VEDKTPDPSRGRRMDEGGYRQSSNYTAVVVVTVLTKLAFGVVFDHRAVLQWHVCMVLLANQAFHY